MKKLLTLATVLLTAALFFTGCSNPANSGGSRGTAPTLTQAYFTVNNPDSSYGTNAFPNKNAQMLMSDATNEYPFAFVLIFSDPDKDVVKCELSTDINFSSDYTSIYEITNPNAYENQRSWFNNQKWSGGIYRNITAYARLTDNNGNKSNTVTLQLTFTNINN